MAKVPDKNNTTKNQIEPGGQKREDGQRLLSEVVRTISNYPSGSKRARGAARPESSD